MIIVPSEEIKKYISIDENGEWIHDPNMPEELKGKFEEFKQQVINAKEYKERR